MCTCWKKCKITALKIHTRTVHLSRHHLAISATHIRTYTYGYMFNHYNTVNLEIFIVKNLQHKNFSYESFLTQKFPDLRYYRAWTMVPATCVHAAYKKCRGVQVTRASYSHLCCILRCLGRGLPPLGLHHAYILLQLLSK